MLNFAFDDIGLSIERRVALILTCTALYRYGIFKIYTTYIDVNMHLISGLILGIFLLNLFIFLMPDMNSLGALLVYLFPLFISISCIIPTIAWVHRVRVSRANFSIMFFCFIMILAIISHDFVVLSSAERLTDKILYPFYPIFFLLINFSLVGSQLLSSLKRSETLAQNLQQKVDEKTAELEASFAELEETRRQQTISDERQRIMLDLHDGIGGHLVNTLAYMENSHVDDPTLKNSLEMTLRDLSLMIDSLENTNSIVTLLGMFRSRIEPLLVQNGIKFKWEIGDEPLMPQTGPSENLNLLRIIQEAVTNAVKHADCDEISIFSDRQSVMISDNGKGFDLANVTAHPNKAGIKKAPFNKTRGLGLISMKKRAANIGALLSVTSLERGTQVRLVWPNFLKP